uniref:Uncharacterized protein n=1 Tax=Anguilla anguilla TaxID=7936 RepID=A0A0E9Q7A9_ANGAN
MEPLWGFSMSKVESCVFSGCFSRSSRDCPSPSDHTVEDTHTCTHRQTHTHHIIYLTSTMCCNIFLQLLQSV